MNGIFSDISDILFGNFMNKGKSRTIQEKDVDVEMENGESRKVQKMEVDVVMEIGDNWKMRNQKDSQHNEDGDWTCKFCPYQTNSYSNLQKHWRVTAHNFYKG